MYLEKQRLQKQRSWFKFQLTGIKWVIEDKYLTPLEQVSLRRIKQEMSLLKLHHDMQSKVLGLNVPEHRCWCNKAAKHQIRYPDDSDNLVWVCNKHKEI